MVNHPNRSQRRTWHALARIGSEHIVAGRLQRDALIAWVPGTSCLRITEAGRAALAAH